MRIRDVAVSARTGINQEIQPGTECDHTQSDARSSGALAFAGGRFCMQRSDGFVRQFGEALGAVRVTVARWDCRTASAALIWISAAGCI